MKLIDSNKIYYRQLNRQIREDIAKGENEFTIDNVLGQRYIGGGLSKEVKITINGVPGQDLGAFMNGPSIYVNANGQDGIGNTMNAGKIVIRGKAGEIPGHSMRGGKVFIKGDVEYRAGIHMKEYMDQVPVLIIGGTAKDYCGEYMAGGRVLVLNLEKKDKPVGMDVGTGIHGGAIFVRGNVDAHQLGVAAVFGTIDDEDKKFLKSILEEYSSDMGIDVKNIKPDEFVKINRKSHRPFGSNYTAYMNVKNTKPKHFNMTPPCMSACPSSIPTPIFLNMIKEGKVKEGQLIMDEFTPFRMSVCGSVCPALCIENCSRGMLDKPVDLRSLTKEYYPDFEPVRAKKQRKEKVAVIGAGPAGLSAAWQLARKGFNVSVYDEAETLGGKLRRAIPRERLSDDTLDKDVVRIKSLPIEFKMKSKIDKAAFDKIMKEYDAVMLATGAHVTKRIPYPGGERILSGLEFLESFTSGKNIDFSGKEVVIIGSGNVGMDIACESWRMGAKSVTAVDIQKPLAFGHEKEAAEALGTKVLWPKLIEKLDANTVYFKDGSSIRGDVVIFSIGEVPDTEYLGDHVLRTDRGYVQATAGSFKTSNPKIFACGDIIKPGLITDAIGMGRYGAIELSAAADGQIFSLPEKKQVPKKRINTVYFDTEEKKELDRCFSCGTCIFCDKCIEKCPQKALSRTGEFFTIDDDKCVACYTCVNVCPRGVFQTGDFEEFKREEISSTME
jgi:putative selenate reductase